MRQSESKTNTTALVAELRGISRGIRETGREWVGIDCAQLGSIADTIEDLTRPTSNTNTECPKCAQSAEDATFAENMLIEMKAENKRLREALENLNFSSTCSRCEENMGYRDAALKDKVP